MRKVVTRGRAAGALAFAAAAALLVTVAAPDRQARAQESPQRTRGAELYARDCLACHGPDGRGVTPTGEGPGAGRGQVGGPPLRGAGAAAVDLYLTTGYMPLRDVDDVPEPSRPSYPPRDIAAIVEYVTSFGGGGPAIPDVDPARGDLAEGQRVFTELCAGCHQVAAEGGLILDGVAPELEGSTPTQVGEAVRVGPYLMPAWTERQLDGSDVDSLARYIRYAEAPRDEGGWAIGHLGPIPEGLIAWLAAGIVLVGVTRVIGKGMR